MPSLISRLIVCAVFIIISYVIYNNYIENNTKLPEITPSPDQNITGSNPVQQKLYLDSTFNGIYLYNPNSDNLYLKRPNPNFNSTNLSVDNRDVPFFYYNAGKGMDCPGILNNDNSSWKMNANSSGIQPTEYILIQDTFTEYSCTNILANTSKYDPSLVSQCGNGSDNAVLYTSAEQYEKKLIDTCKSQGNITAMSPAPNVCYPKDQPSTKQATMGNSPTSNPYGYPFWPNFLTKNRDMIIMMSSMVLGGLGKLVGLSERVTAQAAAKLMGVVSSTICHGMMVYMILPGWFENPGSWEWTKNAIMTGQVVFDKAIGLFIEKFAEKAAVGTAEKGVMEIATETSVETATSMAAEAGSAMLAGTVAFAELLGPVMAVVGVVQLAGMIVDALDPCGFNSTSMNLTQEMLDKWRVAYDQMMFKNAKGITFPTRANPESICEYNLNCQVHYNSCLSDDEKKKTSADEYCKSDSDLYNQYVHDYLSSLKTNSSGECIGNISNAALATMFNTYVGGIDWSFIENMKPSDFVISKDQQIKFCQLFLANENTVVASYINNHFYYVLAVFIIILIIMFLI